MSLLSHGLSELMEACSYSERAMKESDQLVDMLEATADEDVVAAVTSRDQDSVEDDMEGNGVNEKAISDLVDRIPPADELVDPDDIASIAESFIPTSDRLDYLF